MSLEFIVISQTANNESYAERVVSKLRNMNIDVQIDKSYGSNLNTRVAKYRRMEKDIIIVDDKEEQGNTVIVRFFDDGARTKAERMPLEDLADYIETYLEACQEDDEEAGDGDNKGDNITDDSDGVYCAVM